MKIDVVIATYNRLESLTKLVRMLQNCNPQPDKIIIVDASIENYNHLSAIDRVVYIKSDKGNQPYQRYTGYMHSSADIIVFLDDDMEVLENNIFEEVSEQFKNENTGGVALNFVNDNDFLQNSVPKSRLGSIPVFSKLFRLISGVPELEDGKFWLCGLRGRQPCNLGSTEWISGGAFALRHNLLYINFNFKLFELFQSKLGMGEDVILGYTLSKFSNIIYLEKRYFYHNDQKDSTYTLDLYNYSKKVTFSRLYLSYEYCRLNNLKTYWATLHYNWYFLGRTLGLCVNQLLNYNTCRNQVIKGTLSGWRLAIKNRKELMVKLNFEDFKG